MDKKYYKYKSKYIKLKKLLGGGPEQSKIASYDESYQDNITEQLETPHPVDTTKFDLTGPVCIYYLKHKTIDKKIILLGDVHYNYNYGCESNFKIIDYISKLFNESDIQYDLFIESDFHKILSNPDSFVPSDYLTELIQFGLYNYKKKENFRIHFHDIRGLMNGFYKFQNNNLKPIKFYIEETRNEISQNLVKNENITTKQQYREFILKNKKIIKKKTKEAIKEMKRLNNFKKFYLNFLTKDLNDWIFELLDELENDFPSDNQLYKILKKESLKLKNNNPEYYSKIKEFLISKLRKHKAILETPHSFDNFEIFSEFIQNIFHSFLDTTAFITDFYLVCRIMKNPVLINNITYVGVGHIPNIQELLGDDFDLIFSQMNEPQNPTFRCLENITPFDYFFTTGTIL